MGVWGEEEGQERKETIMLTGFLLNKMFFRSVHGGRGEGERVKPTYNFPFIPNAFLSNLSFKVYHV